MAKEIIHTIKFRGDVLHGILNEDSMIFAAVGNTKYGEFTTTIKLEGLEFTILKETIIEWEDESKP